MTNDLFLAILAMDAYDRTSSQRTPQGLILPGGTMLGYCGDSMIASMH